MEKYLNVFLELNNDRVDEVIQSAIRDKQKGYVCSVERNVVTMANIDPLYNQVVNNALVNICDGNFVIKVINILYAKKYKTYIGADLFIKYISMGIYTQYFIGNTDDILNGLKNNLSKYDLKIKGMQFKTLPFMDVEEFDYNAIGKEINKYSPDIIWVSLGAPKQELFMSKLLPYINSGVMFGFGAIFNFYSGIENQKRAPQIFLKFHLEWLYRIYQDPKKNINRNIAYLKILPKLIREEKKKIKSLK